MLGVCKILSFTNLFCVQRQAERKKVKESILASIRPYAGGRHTLINRLEKLN